MRSHTSHSGRWYSSNQTHCCGSKWGHVRECVESRHPPTDPGETPDVRGTHHRDYNRGEIRWGITQSHRVRYIWLKNHGTHAHTMTQHMHVCRQRGRQMNERASCCLIGGGAAVWFGCFLVSLDGISQREWPWRDGCDHRQRSGRCWWWVVAF